MPVAEQAAAETTAEQQPAKAVGRVKTEEEKAAIRKAWYERKAILHYGESLLRVIGGESPYTKELVDALKHGNLETIAAEAAKLKTMGKKIIKDMFCIANPLEIVRRYSLGKAISASYAIESNNRDYYYRLIGRGTKARKIKGTITREEWASSRFTTQEKIAILEHDLNKLHNDIAYDFIYKEMKELKATLAAANNKTTSGVNSKQANRSQEYLEDFYHRLALRKMRQKGWEDFKASTATIEEERAEWQGTEEELCAMLNQSLRAYNKKASAKGRLTDEEVNKIIAKQVNLFKQDEYYNTIKRAGTQDCIDGLVEDYAKKYRDRIGFRLWTTENRENLATQRASLPRVDINRLSKEESEDVSIAVIGGGDLTEGSCASVAQVFAARRLGYHAIDYRGGVSQEVGSNIKKIGYTADIGIFRTSTSNEVFDYIETHTKLGEYYLLGTHRHMAVVKKLKDGDMAFLELQTEKENKWTRFSGPATLRHRFGRDATFPASSQLISFNELAEHFDLLAHNLETIHNTGAQMKGVKGGRK